MLREVAERRQAEHAAAAHAAELESEDDQLRTELARQATYDTDTDSDADEDRPTTTGRCSTVPGDLPNRRTAPGGRAAAVSRRPRPGRSPDRLAHRIRYPLSSRWAHASPRSAAVQTRGSRHTASSAATGVGSSAPG